MAIDIKVAGEAAAAKRALGPACARRRVDALGPDAEGVALEPAAFLSLLLEPPRL